MKIIDLVRHGEPDTSIHDDFLRPLTLTGIRQAEMVSSKLQKQPYTHIFASPLRRSVETVVPLAKKQNISVETNNLLVERKMPEWFDSSQKFTDYINHQWLDFKYYQAGENHYNMLKLGIFLLLRINVKMMSILPLVHMER